MASKYNDPVIDEIRQVRHQISERFDHDPARLVAYYMELQKRHENRLIPLPDNSMHPTAVHEPPTPAAPTPAVPQ